MIDFVTHQFIVWFFSNKHTSQFPSTKNYLLHPVVQYPKICKIVNLFRCYSKITRCLIIIIINTQQCFLSFVIYSYFCMRFSNNEVNPSQHGEAGRNVAMTQLHGSEL